MLLSFDARLNASQEQWLALHDCMSLFFMQVPIQLVSAAMLVSCAGWAQNRLAAADVGAITSLFFFLVLLAATQDIAVDGWALTLLSRQHIGSAV